MRSIWVCIVVLFIPACGGVLVNPIPYDTATIQSPQNYIYTPTCGGYWISNPQTSVGVGVQYMQYFHKFYDWNDYYPRWKQKVYTLPATIINVNLSASQRIFSDIWTEMGIHGGAAVGEFIKSSDSNVGVLSLLDLGAYIKLGVKFISLKLFAGIQKQLFPYPLLDDLYYDLYYLDLYDYDLYNVIPVIPYALFYGFTELKMGFGKPEKLTLGVRLFNPHIYYYRYSRYHYYSHYTYLNYLELYPFLSLHLKDYTFTTMFGITQVESMFFGRIESFYNRVISLGVAKRF